jgi:predicted nucleic acid-binding protein
VSGFLLDTNVPSELVRPQPEPKVKTWVAAQALDTLFISSVSFGELRKGIILRAPGKRRAELEAWIETDLSILFSGRILSVTRSTSSSRATSRISTSLALRYSILGSETWQLIQREHEQRMARRHHHVLLAFVHVRDRVGAHPAAGLDSPQQAAL